jgi:acetyl-CoA carboxylase carboxyltransferase component
LTARGRAVIIARTDMDVVRSRVDTGSEGFRRNRQDMLALLAEVEAQLALARAGGGERSVARHRERGKLLIRERIELLLDRDAPFLELSPLAGWGTDFSVGGGFVSGIGVVSGVECVVCGHDPTVLGGAITAVSLKKINRALEISRLNRLPYVQFVESAGGDLRRGTEDPDAEMRRQLTHFAESGRLFHDITCLSGERIPTVSVVFGSSTAGGAYQPGMSDYNIFIRNRSRVYLGGPPLVKMATGEDADDEELGGGEMHAGTSGLADYLADDEPSAIRMARSVIAHLNWRKLGPGPTKPADEPLYDAEELLGLLPVDLRAPMDVREVIGRITDGSRFEEFKPLYGKTLVCGWASIHGFPVGIIGNNGVLFSDSSQKAAQFIQLCNKIDTPLVFLQNITGYMVGRQYEHGGIVKHGSQMINAVSNSGGAPHHRHPGRELWRGQLRDERPRVRHALCVHVAQREDLDHGPEAARRGHVDRAPRRRARGGAGIRRGGGRAALRGGGGSRGAGVARALRDGARGGRRHHRSAGYAGGARHRAVGGARGRGSRDRPLRRVPALT